MVDMNSDQIFEVPDTPDRMQQSTCPVSIPGARRGIVAGITRNNCFQWNNMVDMNSDQNFEVPDTPDQIQQSARPSPGARRGIRNVARNPLPSPRFKFKIRDDSIQGQSSRDNSSSVLPTPSDAENIFRQAELARLLPAAGLEEKPSSRDSHRTTEASFKYEKGPGKLGTNQQSSSSNHLSYRDTEERSLGYRIRGDISQQDSSCQNVDICGVGSGIPTISMGKPHNIRGSSASDKPKEIVGADICSGSSPRKDKWKTISNKNTTGLSSPTPCIVPQRHASQRKLVRNGCISPSNIVSKSVEVHENREMCSTSRALHNTNPHVDVSEKGYVIDLTDISPTITVRGNTVNDGLTAVNSMETRAARKFRTTRSRETAIPQATNQNCCEGSKKGKEIVHNFIGAKQTGESNMRVCPRSAADSSSIANNDCTDVSSEQGWRTTHNHTSKFPVSLLSRTTSSHGRESGSSGPSNEGNEIVEGDNNNSIGGATTMRTASLGNRILRVGRGKRKQTSSSCHPGECSSSLDEPRGPCLLSSNTTSGRNLTSNCSDIPVINIDDICSHEVRPSSSSSGYRNGTSVDPNIRAQMESDELLARQIQEQLYNETPSVVPTEEIDAIVALSLQHEEDTQRTSRTVRRFQNNTRGARASRSSASQRAFRVGYEAANSMISQVHNASPITFRTRAAYARYPAPHLRANIDLNDYDALLALDENNHQHAGASESQINNLPQSVIQSNSIEPCAVCLENPSMGDTIRHLPCFHKFHKECIDEWLRRKKLCPICKSGIT